VAPTQEQKLELWNDLRRLARETAEFDYIPGRFLQDLSIPELLGDPPASNQESAAGPDRCNLPEGTQGEEG
jgi:hypothetical protein